MKIKYLLIPAVILPAALAFAGMASAHTHTETESCQAGIHADGGSYGGGHLNMTIGSSVFSLDFTGSYTHTISNPDKSKAEPWAISVTKSSDGQGEFSISGTLAACETPPSSTTTTTTIPTTSTSAPTSTTTPPATSPPATVPPASSAPTSQPATTVSSAPSSTTGSSLPPSSTTAAPTPTATTPPSCNDRPTPEQCLHPRHDVTATCSDFVTSGDGWSNLMHSEVTIGGEVLVDDQYAWAVHRDSNAFGTHGYTYRVVVTDDRLPASSYDSGLVTVPACGTVVASPPVHHDSAPTELPATGFLVNLLLIVAGVFLVAGLVARFASRRTHL